MEAGQNYTDFYHTGPDTLAGRYLRRFWHPVHRVKDLAPRQAVPVKLMGESFTLFRGEGGTPYLVDFHCPHRGTQLSTGWVEGESIRCRYHGWRYEGTGQCVEQPGEDESYTSKVKIQSYPTQEYLGLIFVFIGEGDAPPLRRHPDSEQPGVLEAGVPEVWPCNYFNRIDNACDGGHVAFTHRESIMRVKNMESQLAIRTISSEETEYGIRTTSNFPGRNPSYLHFHMPITNQNRSQARVEGTLEDAAKLWVDRLFWRVPIDDGNCISFVVDRVPLTGEAGEAYRKRRQEAEQTQSAPLNQIAKDILTGKMILADVDKNLSTYKLFWIEDYVVQVGQGDKHDRPEDHLGRMDIGVFLLRKIWERELRALAEGQPLKQWKTPKGLADMSKVAIPNAS